MKPYEPKGKAVPLIEAMRARPDRIWSAAEVANLLGVTVREVGAYTKYLLKNRVIYRKGQRMSLVFSYRPFPDQEALPGYVTKPRDYPPRRKRASPFPQPKPEEPNIRPPASVWELGQSRAVSQWPTPQTGTVHLLLSAGDEEEPAGMLAT